MPQHEPSETKHAQTHQTGLSPCPGMGCLWGAPGPLRGPNSLLGHSTDSQTDMAQQLLTSPGMSGLDGNLEPARPCLDVESTNMRMRLKDTGLKVLAGVAGRLRASHLTVIMGASGVPQGCLRGRSAVSYTVSETKPQAWQIGIVHGNTF